MSVSRGKILIAFHDEGPVRGATRAILDVLPLLQDLGWEFAFWAPRPGGAFDELRSEGAWVRGRDRLVRYSWAELSAPPGIVARLASLPRYFGAFSRAVHDSGCDLVHANTIVTMPEALCARAMGRPVVLHVHDMADDSPRWRAAGHVIPKTTAVVLAPSEACSAALARRGIAARVVNYGVLPRNPTPAPRREGLVVGTVGGIEPRKGTDIFVDAARLVLAERPDVSFKLFGSIGHGADEAWSRDILARATAVGIEQEEGPHGREALAGWDMFVLTSRADPFPVVVFEAMAAGVPVVATAVDGVPEQVGDEAGLLVPPEDPEALARSILALAADADRRARIGAAGRRRLEQRFTPERQAQGLDQAYQDALGTRATV
jgi:glycosyltransferase involved in cell wall biosynthesis